MVLSLLSARTLISSCFFDFLLNMFLAYFIVIAIAIPPKPMATPSRTIPTGAATTLAGLAIPIVPAAIRPFFLR